MLQAYLNYPNPHVFIHRRGGCPEIGKMTKVGQRRIRIDPAAISHELQQFAAKAYPFAADRLKNDMWLEVDFGDPDFELAVVEHVRHLVGMHYTPFAAVKVETHCS
jgi:hypothetical protein